MAYKIETTDQASEQAGEELDGCGVVLFGALILALIIVVLALAFGAPTGYGGFGV